MKQIKILVILIFICTLAKAKSNAENFVYVCAVGVEKSIKVFGKNTSSSQQETMSKRGENTCMGAVKRLHKNGQLKKEKNIVEFSCGYAIGAMAAKYGLEKELDAKKPSKRVTKLLSDCIRDSKNYLKQ